MIRRTILLALLCVAPTVLRAELDPNTTRGFAGKVYELGDLDSINVFNGNLTVRIPIGPRYTVGPALSYQLVLANNSKVWDTEITLDHLRRSIPEPYSNAGLGWILSMGRMIPPRSGPIHHGWIYVSPDGAQHEFTHTPGQTFLVTKDGSYLRLKLNADYGYHTIEFPDGTIHIFETDGRLKRIKDRFDNWVGVTYDTVQCGSVLCNRWTITDGHGITASTRSHTVTFTNKAAKYNPANFQQVVSTVQLAAFGTQTTTYSFEYEDDGGSATSVPRQGCNGEQVDSVLAPLLASINLPDGSSYGMSYLTNSQIDGTCSSGGLKRMTLPTGGAIAWQYGDYFTTLQDCNDQDYWTTSYGGVVKRTIYASQAIGAPAVAEWNYTSTLVMPPPPIQWYGQYCNGEWEHQMSVAPSKLMTTVIGPTGDKSVHYFSVYPPTALASKSNFKGSEYSLPLNRHDELEAGGRALSSEVYDCVPSGCANGETLLKKTYAAYETDGFLNGGPANSRVSMQRVVDPTDTGCGGECYVDTNNFEWDGFGHYKKTTTTSNFPGAVERTSYTNYTPDSTNWLLNLYTFSWVKQGTGGTATGAKAEATFDLAKGVVKSLRALKTTSSTPESLSTSDNDTLSVICRDNRGFVESERFFGGDNASVPSGDPCAAPQTAGGYFINHDYSFANTLVSAHEAQYSGTNYLIADEQFDVRTGLRKEAKDSAEVATQFSFDASGRISSAKPAATAWTMYDYERADETASGRATVTVQQTANGNASNVLTESIFEFDAFGRAYRERRLLKDGSWSSTDTRYDPDGRKSKVSLTTAWSGHSVEPSLWTTTTFDAIGRPKSITAPDGKQVTFTYAGSRLSTRTFSVATSTSAESTTSVEEERDAFGRLIRVREAADTASWVEAKYKYDYADRLINVSIESPGVAAQQRSFAYDGRGFLTSETHPESGTTTYQYDARGHATSRTTAAGTLSFQYDSAERLSKVLSGSSPLKEFFYNRPNNGNDYALGKLARAVRHNDQPLLGGDITVTETFTYEGLGGALSKKETSVSTGEAFTDSYAYTELGSPLSVTYPQCVGGGCAGINQPARTVTNTYVNGYLSSVGNYAGPIEYHPNGLVKSVQHKSAGLTYGTFVNGPLYEQKLNAAVPMARPDTIQVSNACTNFRVDDPPDSATINSGQTVQLNVTITGATSYQWYTGANVAVGTNSSSLTVNPTVTTKYWVRASNGTCTIDSAPATLTVNSSCSAPSATITAQSVMGAGRTVSASVTETAGATYQWSITGGTITSGATSPTVTVRSNCSASNVVLSVVVTASCGTSSNPATHSIAVEKAPATVSGTATINSGQSAVIYVDLNGLVPWQITWSDGVVETVPSTAISPWERTVSPTQTTQYTATVIDGTGCPADSSGVATVTVNACEPIPAGVDHANYFVASATGSASTQAVPGASYEWIVENGTLLSGQGTSSITFRAGCSDGKVQVNVTSACGYEVSSWRKVWVTPLSVDVTGAAINQGGSATLTATMVGTPPFRLIWSDGVEQNNVNAASQTRTVTPGQTTEYTVTALDAHGCSAMSPAATVTVTPPAPTLLGASATASDRVLVSWSFTGTADRFEIERLDRLPGSPLTYRVIGTAAPAATSHLDIGLPANTAALYRVVAVKGGTRSTPSAFDLATTTIFTDGTLVPNVTPKRAVHVVELRTAVNAVRALAGLTATSFTDPDLALSPWVRAVHITELRNSLNAARSTLALSPTTFQDNPLTSGHLFRFFHITELRGGVQ